MDSDFVVGINKAIDAAKGESHEYPAYLHNTLVTEKLDELTEAISEGGVAHASIDELDDVTISNPQGGECLKYNATTHQWENGDDAGNVQSDWNESDPTSGAYILNKPTIPDAQVQANWNESDSSSMAYIQNKPTIQNYAEETGTLIAGEATVTFTNSSVTSNSTIDPYVDDAFTGVVPTGQVIDENDHTVTLTFPVQSVNIPVKVRIS